MADELSSRASSGGPSTEITLGLLNAVQENARLTQRSAAHQLGIALGLTNAYLKRCIKKGLIKVQQVPRKRYAYYLTPQGFAEKSRLTAEYLSSSLSFFRRAREQLGSVMEQCARRGWRQVALAGTGDLAEIAVLCARDHALTVVGIIDSRAAPGSFAQLPVVAYLADLEAVDAVVVTDFTRAQATHDALAVSLPAERLLAPRMLGVVRQPALAESADT